MKAAVAILLVVAVAGFVECLPTLKESVQARLSQLHKRGKDGGKGKEDFDWPYGWIEFSQLIGKCESARNTLEAFNITLSEDDKENCILAEACPIAIEIGGHIMAAEKEDRKHFSDFINGMFPLLQCVNLEATKEGVMFSLYLNEQDVAGNIYLTESTELFNLCQMVFDSLDKEEKEFEDNMQKADETLVGSERRALQNQLRRLLQIASRKY